VSIGWGTEEVEVEVVMAGFEGIWSILGHDRDGDEL